MASAGRGQFESDESEEELYTRGDKKTVPKSNVKNKKRETANEWNTASNEGESNTSSRTPIQDESSTNTFRYDQQPSAAAVPKNTSGKKKQSRKAVDEKPVMNDGSHMVDTLSDTTETQHFDSFNKEEQQQPAAATNTGKLKSIFHRESFKNMGKVLSAKMHSSNLDAQDESEELNRDQQNNKHQSHTNPMNWMKDRFRKQNKDTNNELSQPRSDLHGIEMDEINLDSSNDGRIEGTNLLMANNPATMTLPRPISQNNSYAQTLSTAVDVGDEGLMLMNEKERKIYAQKMCMSVALAIILIAGVILGIILWAMSSFGLAFKILGPTIFGLSLFALVYKMFLTFIWKEDPYQYFYNQFQQRKQGKSPK